MLSNQSTTINRWQFLETWLFRCHTHPARANRLIVLVAGIYRGNQLEVFFFLSFLFFFFRCRATYPGTRVHGWISNRSWHSTTACGSRQFHRSAEFTCYRREISGNFTRQDLPNADNLSGRRFSRHRAQIPPIDRLIAAVG